MAKPRSHVGVSKTRGHFLVVPARRIIIYRLVFGSFLETPMSSPPRNLQVLRGVRLYPETPQKGAEPCRKPCCESAQLSRKNYMIIPSPEFKANIDKVPKATWNSATKLHIDPCLAGALGIRLMATYAPPNSCQEPLQTSLLFLSPSYGATRGTF